MYKVKPHFELPENIELPDCIYQQRPVNPTIKVSRSRPASGTASPGIGGLNVNGTLEPINMNSLNNSAKVDPKARSPGSGGGGRNKNKNKPSPSQSKTPATPTASSSSSNTQLVSQEKVQAMEERQHALINRIANLHRTISTIHEQECLALASRSRSSITLTRVASESDINLSSSSGSDVNLLEGDFVDIVINADPVRPPYSILFFYKLLQQVYGPGSVVIRALTHSSVTVADVLQSQSSYKSKAATYSKYLTVFNNNVEGIDSRKKRIILTVIWKRLNHGGPELILNPLNQTTLLGEENIARFLSRILPRDKFPKLNYDALEWDTLVRVDSFLDYNHLRSLESLESHLHVLNGGAGSDAGKNKLGTASEFLAGVKEPTIADFFMFSHTAHEALAGGGGGVDDAAQPQLLQSLTKYSNIMKWLWACQQYGGFTVFEI